MVTNPRRQNEYLQSVRSDPSPPPEQILRLPNKSFVRQLQEVLWDGAAVTSILWNYRTKDWVTGIQAADIDNDGDIEVLLSSRDGIIRAHTPWGAKKWEKKWKNQSISALFAIPIAGVQPYRKAVQRQACVIVGMRDGQVYALDQEGIQIQDWQYSTGRMIRQIYVNKDAPDSIIIGSEDRHVHVLDRATGKPHWPPYHANGWVRSVFSCDLDNDQRNEILVGSADEHLHILDDHGQFLAKLFLGHQIYALFAASLRTDEPKTVITSSNRKDLYAWKVRCCEGGQWVQQKEWEIRSESELFENRIQAIYIDDINNDQEPEILLGSEDGCLYVLDKHGSLLWKRRFGSGIYSIWASDINFDGQKEVLIGAEDNGVYVVQVELGNDFYTRINKVYRDAIQDEQVASRNELMKVLTPREKAILKDFIDEFPPLRHVQMEVERAVQLMQEGHYEQALSLFLRARQQRVQYCWSQPVTTHGYILTLGIGQVEQKEKYDLLAGTDEGYIYAIDGEQGTEKHIWQKDVQNRVRMLQAAPLRPGELDSIAAILDDHCLVILNNQGEIVQEHTFEKKEGWPRSVYINTHPTTPNEESEILLDVEDKKIAIWDAHLEQERRVIQTLQGISILTVSKLSQSDEAKIISGSINNHVYVHDQHGNMLWSFQTQDRVQALCVEDIDRDGYAEIIVGSEDRNVYVLDHEGHLKWRYRTQRGVLDVTVCDIRLNSDPQDEDKRRLEVLACSADGYIYVLTAFGDLLWKYKGGNRIRAIRARDINNDGTAEIAMASENRLELLQILSRKQIHEYIQDCWDKWFAMEEDRHKALMEATYHPDEFIRAYALARLAGQYQRHEDDVKRFQEALRNDDSIEVKKELVRSIVLFLLVPTNKEENARQARYFLHQLSADPDPDIRLEIVNILSKLLEIDEGLCFEYIEYFTHNVDMWVRRAVVRQLDALVKDHPDRTFDLLLNTINDEEEWVQQETGRALSHYFDVHPRYIIRDSIALLEARTDTAILEQISYSARQPAIKGWFHCLVLLLTELNKQTITNLLENTIEAIQELQVFAPIYGSDFYQVYTELRRILQIHSSSGIARYQWINTAEDDTSEDYKVIRTCMRMFDKFQEISNVMRTFERHEAIRDRVTCLINATDKVEEIRTELQRAELQYKQAYPSGYKLPEMVILSIATEQHYQIIKSELYRLRGNAQIVAEIRNKEVQREEEVVVSLLISNKGVSAADNIKVRIVEVEQDFSVIGAKEHSITQLPNGGATSVEFMIKPQGSAPRLKFYITYDDAEKHGKQEEFADIILLQNRQRPYIEIPNPYTSGTPIRDRKMFYGRRNDIDTLHEKLSSVTANKVVVLSGQRRMGKTSLIYQLANELTSGPQVPILIDLQGQALQTMGHLFAGLALRVCEEVHRRRQITLTAPDREAFQANPTESFDAFLNEALQALNNEKIVFLLDEFEVLQEKINKGPLDQDVLHYLRSLMQHRQGLNFLLVGAPRIRHVTEPSWSVFFNISLQHRLGKLASNEAEALIAEPIRGCLEYDMLALERMRRLSGDLPYFIHVLSEILIAYCNQRHKSYVTVNDINNVLDIVLDEQSGSINWIWNQSSSFLEHFLLSVLAQDKGEDGRIFTLSDIYTEFDAQGVPYEQEKVTSTLQDLVREDLIEELRNGMQFRLPVGLVKEWLRKVKPPERVIRDESPL